MCAFPCVCVCFCMCACVRACLCACVCPYACVNVCVWVTGYNEFDWGSVAYTAPNIHTKCAIITLGSKQRRLAITWSCLSASIKPNGVFMCSNYRPIKNCTKLCNCSTKVVLLVARQRTITASSRKRRQYWWLPRFAFMCFHCTGSLVGSTWLGLTVYWLQFVSCGTPWWGKDSTTITKKWAYEKLGDLMACVGKRYENKDGWQWLVFEWTTLSCLSVRILQLSNFYVICCSGGLDTCQMDRCIWRKNSTIHGQALRSGHVEGEAASHPPDGGSLS